MKLSQRTMSIIIAAAVLLAAYGLGLVIRHARLGNGTRSQAPAEPLPKRTTQPTPEQRAKAKEARAQKLEESRNLTADQKEQYKNSVVQRVSPAPRQDANAPMGRSMNSRNMTDEQRQAFQQRMQARHRPSAAQTSADANGNGPATGGTAPTQDVKNSASVQDANRP